MICECHKRPGNLKCGTPNKCPDCRTCWACCSCAWLETGAAVAAAEIEDLLGQCSESIEEIVAVAIPFFQGVRKGRLIRDTGNPNTLARGTTDHKVTLATELIRTCIRKRPARA